MAISNPARRFLIAGSAMLFAFATYAASGPDDRGQISYDDLCKYDDMCNKLKNQDGTFVPAKADVLQTLAVLKDEIKTSALELGVDSRAVAGAILAENSMNVQIDDGIQNFLVGINIAGIGPATNGSVPFLNRPMSIGLGQIYVDSARTVEPLLAQIEKRPQRSDQEIATALLTPSGAIKYAAALIRKSQDDYAAGGHRHLEGPGHFG